MKDSKTLLISPLITTAKTDKFWLFASRATAPTSNAINTFCLSTSTETDIDFLKYVTDHSYDRYFYKELKSNLGEGSKLTFTCPNKSIANISYISNHPKAASSENFFINETEQNTNASSQPDAQSLEYEQPYNHTSRHTEASYDYPSTTQEDKLVLKRLEKKLTSAILDSNFEYGYVSDVDQLIEGWMKENKEKALYLINAAYLRNYQDIDITLGIVRAISRINYANVFPVGQTIALAALSHESELVVEAGIRAYEMWDKPESIRYLKSARTRSKWLNSYLNSVIEELSTDYAIS